MEQVVALIAFLVFVALVAAVVLGPLRRSEPADPSADGERAGLEAAKRAKYQEIRDAELDFRMGKLSERDWRATDRELRAQAIEILKQLDRVEERRR